LGASISESFVAGLAGFGNDRVASVVFDVPLSMDSAAAPFIGAPASISDLLPPPFELTNISGIKNRAIKIPAEIAAAKIHLIL